MAAIAMGVHILAGRAFFLGPIPPIRGLRRKFPIPRHWAGTENAQSYEL